MKYFQVETLVSKATAMRDIPIRRMNWLESFRTKSLKECIAAVRQSSDMSIINAISTENFGVSTIVQLTSTGSLIAWRKAQLPTEAVVQVPLSTWVQNFEVNRVVKRNGRVFRSRQGRDRLNNRPY